MTDRPAQPLFACGTEPVDFLCPLLKETAILLNPAVHYEEHGVSVCLYTSFTKQPVLVVVLIHVFCLVSNIMLSSLLNVSFWIEKFVLVACKFNSRPDKAGAVLLC